MAAAATVIGAVCAAPAAAQCVASGIPSWCTQPITLQFVTQRTVRDTIAPTSFSFTVTLADYNQGYTQALGHSVTVLANAAWTLSISSGSANWTASGGARATKPQTDLRWATGAGGTYTPMSVANATVASGTATGGTVVSVYYRALWSWTLDSPGTYTLPVVFLITAP